MILDQLSRCDLYRRIHPHLGLGFDFLLKNDLERLPTGRREIDGERVFAIVDEYTTRPAELCRLESHRKYWDIQYLVRGAERIGYCPLERVGTTLESYDASRDIAFYAGTGTPLLLTGGMFAVFGPRDAHAPQIAAGEPAPVRKIVVKVAI